MKRNLMALVLVGLLIAVAGCAAAAPRPANTTVSSQAVLRAPAAAPAVVAGVSGAKDSSGAVQAVGSGTVSDAAAVVDSTRMIIKNASLSLVVSDAETSLATVTRLATDLGGYVSNSKSWRESEKLRATVTLRIPAEKLDQALETLRGLAVRVNSENVTGQDVTEQFSDLGAQLKNLKATETELQALLTTVREKMQKAEDVLAVYRELTTIRGQIEQVQGRMQYLSNLTSMATITVDLIPDVLAQPVAEPGWRPAETLQGATRSLINALRGIVDAGIVLVVFVLPVLFVVIAPIVLLVKLLRRLSRRGRKGKGTDKSAPPAAPAASGGAGPA